MTLIKPASSAESRHAARMFPCLLLTLCMASCDQTSTNDSSRPTVPSSAPAKPSAWKAVDGAFVVDVDDQDIRQAMADAIDQARATAPEARERWLLADAAERERWSVKWTARTVDNSVEHVWVKPLSWSPFRIEGVIANNPVQPLECSKKAGDLVGFPIEELSDWMLAPDRGPGGHAPRQGGFTVELLERRFGVPSEGR